MLCTAAIVKTDNC